MGLDQADGIGRCLTADQIRTRSVFGSFGWKECRPGTALLIELVSQKLVSQELVSQQSVSSMERAHST